MKTYQKIQIIRTIIEDTRAAKLGAMNIAFTIWEMSVLPALLHNAETWVEMRKKTLNILKQGLELQVNLLYSSRSDPSKEIEY